MGKKPCSHCGKMLEPHEQYGDDLAKPVCRDAWFGYIEDEIELTAIHEEFTRDMVAMLKDPQKYFAGFDAPLPLFADAEGEGERIG